jgi:pimeloyl-ACP methyl ester carboxylesterase
MRTITATTGTAHPDLHTQLYWESTGTGPPLLLVMGLGLSGGAWWRTVATLSSSFRVITFDNRGVGRSRGLSPAYTTEALADDAVAVLDALGWSSAHVLGPSLGGMIGQVMAVRHPDRVRSLTSLSSAPAWGLRFSKPNLRIGLKAALLNVKGGKGRDAAIERTVKMFQLIGSPKYPFDEQWLRDVATRAYDIDPDPKGGMRQLKAIKASGDRRADLAKIKVPTLVVHGEIDPLQSVSAGRATAAAIPGARLLVLPDAGHVLPVQLWPQVLDELGAMLDAHELRA